MNKSDFISNLIRKLDDCDTLDRQNYNDEKDQLCDIYELIDEYLKDFTIIQGKIIQ